LPIVQSGVTVKVAVSNLTAGRDIAATSLTTAAIQAASSAGGTLKNNSGTAQMQWGSGGGSNLSLEVATNINPANAAVSISPTGTGTVAISPAGALTINPTTASTINNTSIGATTASTGRFTSVTATTGNVVIGTSGQGIDFSATPGTGTSELFNDYEEGSWAPAFSTNDGSGYPLSSATARYTKIGRIVHIEGSAVFDSGPPGGGFVIPSLPFTPSSTCKVLGTFSIGDNGDAYLRDGPSGNWVLVGSNAYAIVYGNNTNSLWNGIAATDLIGFSFMYSV
jgi:hypothetical protein